MKEPNSEFADAIVPDAVPEHTAPARDEFKPWHKVRKQFIREHQWNNLVARMVKRYLGGLQTDAEDWSLEFEGDEDVAEVPDQIRVERPLKCLVIPGDDLLDLRALWRHLRPLNCYIKYLGFNEAQGSDQEGTRVHVAHNDVTSLHHVSRESVVLADRFQSVASLQSQAYRYLKEFGPFHLVNLDLCDTLFPIGAERQTDYYNALYRVAEYQMKNQTSPWLLFITTQVEPGAANADALGKLCAPTKKNYDTHTDFADRVCKLLPKEAFTSSDVVDVSKLSEHHMADLFGIALGKWLITLAASGSPNWIVQMLKSYRYSIKPETSVEMLSLAFLFRPRVTPPTDPTGISAVEVAIPKFPDERESAIRLLSAVERLADVDKLLADDESMCTAMEINSADLLESAGYDREAYVAWVRAGENC